MTSPQRSQTYKSIIRNSPQINYKANIFRKQNSDPPNSNNIFSNISLSNTYKKQANNIFNKARQQQEANHSKINLQQSDKAPLIQVKIMYTDRQQNISQKEESIKKQQKIKKMKEEQEEKKRKRIQQLQQKRKSSAQAQISSDEVKGQIIVNKLATIQNQSVEPEFFTQKQQREGAGKQLYNNRLQIISQNSIQESQVKPKNKLIQSTHSQQSGLTYFKSQEQPQSNKKIASNLLNEQLEGEIKPQLKMTDSARLTNQIKQTSSYGIMSKTSNSLRDKKREPNQQILYEMQTRKAESQSQPSDGLSQFNSSRIVQKKQVKDDSDKNQLTKSQNTCENKINKNLQIKSVQRQKGSNQNIIIKNIKPFIESLQHQQKRKSSQNSIQQDQVPKKLQYNISFGPQFFQAQKQKSAQAEQKIQIKRNLIQKFNQKNQNFQQKLFPNTYNNQNNSFKGDILKKRQQVLKKNIFENINQTNKIEQNTKKQSQQYNIVQNNILNDKDDQYLPCFKDTAQNQEHIVSQKQKVTKINFQINQKRDYQKGPNLYVDKISTSIKNILEMCQKKKQLFEKVQKLIQKSKIKFSNNFCFVPQNLFQNAHSLLLLKNLSEKLRISSKNDAKQQKQKFLNYMDQLSSLGKKVKKYSSKLCGYTENQNIFSNNKYIVIKKPVISQEIQQNIQKVLLKYRLNLKQCQNRLKKLQQQQNLLKDKYIQKSSDSSDQQVFINDFAFGLIQNKQLKNKQGKKSGTKIKNSPSTKYRNQKQNKRVSSRKSQTLQSAKERLKILQRIQLKAIKQRIFKITKQKRGANLLFSDQLNKKNMKRPFEHENKQKITYKFMDQSEDQYKKKLLWQIQVEDSWEIQLQQDFTN